MSLHDVIITYLTTVRDDAHESHRIDKLTALLTSYKKYPLEETQAHSKKIAGFVNLLFQLMPEIKEADLHYQKLYPLFLYCNNLPKPKKIPKAGAAPRTR